MARRRKLIWARMSPAISSITNIGAGSPYSESQDLLQTFRTQAGITAGPVGLTVMRMRFAIHSQTMPSNAAAQLTFGVRVMDTTEALAAEIDATPYIPANDPHADWMCHEPLGPLALNGALFIVNHYIDVRAMRKMEELGQTLVAVLGSVPPNGGGAANTFTISVSSSVLLALP